MRIRELAWGVEKHGGSNQRDIVDKRCSNCGEVKPKVEFYVQSSTPDSRMAWCKVCVKRHANARNKRLKKMRDDVKEEGGIQ